MMLAWSSRALIQAADSAQRGSMEKESF